MQNRISQSGGNVGIGFAIPVNMVKNIVKNLKDNGKVKRGYLGVTLQPIEKAMAEKFGMKKSKGALISDVMKDSPAEKAGLKRGDIILTVDGKEINDVNDTITQISNTLPEKDVKIVVFRDKKEVMVIVKLGNRSEDIGKNLEEITIFGMKLKSKEDLGKEKTKDSKRSIGAVVTEVENGSDAAFAGISVGEVITEVDKQEIKSLKEIKDIYDKAKAGEDILFYIEGKNSRYVVIEKK